MLKKDKNNGDISRIFKRRRNKLKKVSSNKKKLKLLMDLPQLIPLPFLKRKIMITTGHKNKAIETKIKIRKLIEISKSQNIRTSKRKKKINRKINKNRGKNKNKEKETETETEKEKNKDKSRERDRDRDKRRGRERDKGKDKDKDKSKNKDNDSDSDKKNVKDKKIERGKNRNKR